MQSTAQEATVEREPLARLCDRRVPVIATQLLTITFLRSSWKQLGRKFLSIQAIREMVIWFGSGQVSNKRAESS